MSHVPQRIVLPASLLKILDFCIIIGIRETNLLTPGEYASEMQVKNNRVIWWFSPHEPHLGILVL